MGMSIASRRPACSRSGVCNWCNSDVTDHIRKERRGQRQNSSVTRQVPFILFLESAEWRACGLNICSSSPIYLHVADSWRFVTFTGTHKGRFYRLKKSTLIGRFRCALCGEFKGNQHQGFCPRVSNDNRILYAVTCLQFDICWNVSMPGTRLITDYPNYKLVYQLSLLILVPFVYKI
jgi:hypothetical protein